MSEGKTPVSGKSNMKGLVPRPFWTMGCCCREWVSRTEPKKNPWEERYIYLHENHKNKPFTCSIYIPYIDDMGNINQHNQLTVDFLALRLRIGHPFRQACFVLIGFWEMFWDDWRWWTVSFTRKWFKRTSKMMGKTWKFEKGSIPATSTCCLKVRSSWWWAAISLNPGKGCLLTAITNLQRHHNMTGISSLHFYGKMASFFFKACPDIRISLGTETRWLSEWYNFNYFWELLKPQARVSVCVCVFPPNLICAYVF